MFLLCNSVQYRIRINFFYIHIMYVLPCSRSLYSFIADINWSTVIRINHRFGKTPTIPKRHLKRKMPLKLSKFLTILNWMLELPQKNSSSTRLHPFLTSVWKRWCCWKESMYELFRGICRITSFPVNVNVWYFEYQRCFHPFRCVGGDKSMIESIDRAALSIQRW